MQRSGVTIGTIAGALAKAQAQLVNPEKSQVGTIRSEQPGGSERSFRYAPLSGGLDKTMRLWDVETHELIGTFKTHQTAIRNVAFSPQRGLLVSVGEADSIAFWEVDFDRWSSRACRLANRNLTPQEWSTYLGNRPYQKTCPNL